MKVGVLGGGIAGVSLACFLDPSFDVTVLESNTNPGGLASSHEFQGFHYDVGPHIIFSRKKEVLDFMLSVDPDGLGQYRRSNQVWYKNRFIKYPFENFLGSLPEEERKDCLYSFLNNPYEGYAPENMLQFFLKNFGSGITNTYLRPYNEKIWKYDPSFLDLQMVERIPKPPKQDVIDGANGNPKEGYTHQLMFYYPKKGGIQDFFYKMVQKMPTTANYLTGQHVSKIALLPNQQWEVHTKVGDKFIFDQIVNCMPLHSLFAALQLPEQPEVKNALAGLRYNSLYYGLAVFDQDQAGDNFAFNIPEREVIFHRLSKINFIGENHPAGKSAFLFEVTYRKDMEVANASPDEIQSKVLDGIEKMGFASRDNLLGFELKNVDHAYVIYDLNHRKNTDRILSYLKNFRISCLGRFAEHEYLNMDQVIERAQALAPVLNKEFASAESKDQISSLTF